MNSQETLDARSFPDEEARRRYEALVGIDALKTELVQTISVALKPDGFLKWAKRYNADNLTDLVLHRPQLFILEGDVGTGKTELAQTVGDAVARRERLNVTLFSLSLSARGTGLVGEMTQRLVSAFREVQTWGEKRKSAHSAAALLFIDEADAIAQSRESSQMHHEDRAGVNALIRGIDDLSRSHIPVATLMATNRVAALDPAVRRRAAIVFSFARPNDEQRRHLFKKLLPQGTTPEDVLGLVEATGLGSMNSRPYGFTYSDIVHQLVPRAALAAYAANEPLLPARIIALARSMKPTPPFEESSG